MNTEHKMDPRAGRPLRPFTAGLLVSQGFRVTMANLAPFFLLTAICTAPALVWEYAAWKQAPVIESSGVLWEEPARDESGVVLWSMLRFLLSILLNYLAQATVCYGTIQYLSGRRASFGESFRNGLARLVPVIGVSLAAGLWIALGLLLLVVPGVIFACMLYVAVPAAVVESSGVRASLARSIRLTEGFRFKLFLAGLCFVIVSYLVSLLFGFLMVAFSLHEVIGQDAAWMAGNAVMVFFATAGAVFAGVAYVLLRERKEGVQVAQLAEVFA